MVVPFANLRALNDKWWGVIRQTLKIYTPPPKAGIEAKWAILSEYKRRMEQGKDVSHERFRALVNWEVTAPLAEQLMKELMIFLATEPDLTLLGIVVNKKENWTAYCGPDWNTFEYLKTQKAAKSDVERVRARLMKDVLSKAFEWGILQRTQYLMEERGGSPCMLIGDEGSAQQTWYQHQSRVQQGFGRYSDASHIVHNVVFGSSMYSPGLQMADWVANAIRMWAIGYPRLLSRIVHRFRGAPDRVIGQGIVTVPNAGLFPALPTPLQLPADIAKEAG